MQHEYFPPELIALREEIENHPDLLVILSVQASSDIYVHIAEIAAYCQIALNGTFSREEIIKICGLCVNELRAKRTIIVS